MTNTRTVTKFAIFCFLFLAIVPIHVEASTYSGQYFVVNSPDNYQYGRDTLSFLENHRKYFVDLFPYNIPKVSVYVVENLVGRAQGTLGYAGTCEMHIKVSQWDSYLRHALLHELTHIWLGTEFKYTVRWFDEGFAEFMSVTVFELAGDTADKAYMQSYFTWESSGSPNIAGALMEKEKDLYKVAAYVSVILEGYTKSYGIDWIKRFLRYLKDDGGSLETDTSVVAYLSAAVGKDLSDFYISHGLSIDKAVVSKTMDRRSIEARNVVTMFVVGGTAAAFFLIILVPAVYESRRKRALSSLAPAKQKEAPAKPGMKACVRCGSKLPADAEYCDECGARQRQGAWQ